jgi:hypothetical protein
MKGRADSAMSRKESGHCVVCELRAPGEYGCESLRQFGYSIFDSGVYRIHGLKWLFPQEKATFDALVMFTSEAKML